MPRLNLDGFQELVDAFAKLSNVPEEVTEKALTAMEEVAAEKIKASGRTFRVYDSRSKSDVHVLDKIKMNKPKKTASGGYADVTFSGSRTRHGTQTRNAEIAFINEYGKRSQQARPFVGEAMEKNAGLDVILDWTEKEFTR